MCALLQGLGGFTPGYLDVEGADAEDSTYAPLTDTAEQDELEASGTSAEDDA